MNDPLKGKYQKLYKKEFRIAEAALIGRGGKLEWGVHNYEAFTYVEEDVRLIFYPHRTTARNYHIRIRDNGSRDKELALDLMYMLEDAAGSNCTFTFFGINLNESFRRKFESEAKRNPK